MEKHNTLYFTDGNIVLLTPRPEQPALLFRLHKSVLSSHSPVFSDIFDVCGSSDGVGENDINKTYDGLPMIYISDDAHHFESVLKILYYQSLFPWIPRSPHSPERVAPILCLARKYGIDRMLEQAQEHFQHDWPQTLNDWDKLEREIELMKCDVDAPPLDDRLPEPATAINLARQFNVPSILPAAFYHLSRLSILDDWDRTHADVPIPAGNRTRRTARWGLLSAKDFHCLLLGRAELAEFLRGCIKPETLRHGEPCQEWHEVECRMAETLWKTLLDRCLQDGDPLTVLKLEGGVIFDSNKQCSTCVETLRAKISVVRVEIWNGLGKMFHLEDR